MNVDKPDVFQGGENFRGHVVGGDLRLTLAFSGKFEPAKAVEVTARHQAGEHFNPDVPPMLAAGAEVHAAEKRIGFAAAVFLLAALVFLVLVI